jgi:hypothetical protein
MCPALRDLAALPTAASHRNMRKPRTLARGFVLVITRTYARGKPRPRVATMLRWISLVPPAIVEDTVCM